MDEFTQKTPAIFISHCSVQGEVDKVAQRLKDLIGSELFAGDEQLINREVFFTGSAETGMRPGEQFAAMLRNVQQARVVVAVVTKETNRSIAMLAEMAVATANATLLPVATRRSYRRLLSWPFDSLHMPALDNAEDVRGLLREIANRCGLPETAAARPGKRCDDFAHWVTDNYTDLVGPRRSWKIAAAASCAAAIIAAAIGYWGGSLQGREQLTSMQHGVETLISGVSVCVVYQGTLPRKQLVKRMDEILEAVKKLDDPSDKACDRGTQPTTRVVHPEALVRKVFVEALKITGALDDRKELVEIAQRWKNRQPGPAPAGDQESKAPKQSDHPNCDNKLEQTDRDWCNVVVKPGPESAKRFDDTEFAIVRIGDEFVALAAGKRVPGRGRWQVRTVRSVMIAAQP